MTRDYILQRLELIRAVAASGDIRRAQQLEASLHTFALGTITITTDMEEARRVADLALSSYDVITNAIRAERGEHRETIPAPGEAAE